MYLDELQEMLSINCGQAVSRSTIWQMLRNGGFTMKKVCVSFTLFDRIKPTIPL